MATRLHKFRSPESRAARGSDKRLNSTRPGQDSHRERIRGDHPPSLFSLV